MRDSYVVPVKVGVGMSGVLDGKGVSVIKGSAIAGSSCASGTGESPEWLPVPRICVVEQLIPASASKPTQARMFARMQVTSKYRRCIFFIIPLPYPLLYTDTPAIKYSLSVSTNPLSNQVWGCSRQLCRPPQPKNFFFPPQGQVSETIFDQLWEKSCRITLAGAPSDPTSLSGRQNSS